jgi:pimeloyl-ACP methyl ester carboxylesterase
MTVPHDKSAVEHRAVPGTIVKMLPGVGHAPNLEDPPRTAAHLLACTAKHAERGRRDRDTHRALTEETAT